MEHPPEIQEEILKKVSVRDLIRCKSVCKSWCKMISRHDFIRSHLNHSYLSDQRNNAFGDRRLVISRWRGYYKNLPYDTSVKVGEFYDDRGIIGSCHGLVCASHSHANIVVFNPSTTEVKKVTDPQISIDDFGFCWGFGYDETTADYKVFCAYHKDWQGTYIKVLSLRSNMWKDLGEVDDFIWLTFKGVLCKGVLHWLAFNTSYKLIILSFNLSDETFTALPEPENVFNQSMITELRLGTLEGCLCLFKLELHPSDLWVLKDYNNKQSWELYGCENEMKPDAVYALNVSNLIPNTRPFLHDPWFGHIKGILMACSYVESLVSPHFEKETEEKETDNEHHPEEATSIIQSPNW
ncbi:F-box protein CPR1-like protein [Tanacetum coccineum]